MKDQDFLADATKMHITITASSGEKVQQIVTSLHSTTNEVINRAKQIIEP
jgi:hypothetical protein